MSIFPDIISVTILDNDTRQRIPNLAIFIKLFARHKNDYSFIPDISNNRGEIEIKRDWLIHEINAERNLFIMDYASMLDDCYPKFEVRTLNEEEMKRAIQAMNLFKSALGTKQEDIDRLSLVDNPKYESISTIVDLHGERVIEAELKTKMIK